MKKTRLVFAAVFAIVTAALPQKAQANSFGDAVLTVGISSGVGAVLGLSTLPFYSESGKHTQNIWIGAAIGAVVGVGFSAFSALKSSNNIELEEDYEEAEKQDFSYLSPPDTSRTQAPISVALAGRSIGQANEPISFVAPIRILTF